MYFMVFGKVWELLLLSFVSADFPLVWGFECLILFHCTQRTVLSFMFQDVILVFCPVET